MHVQVSRLTRCLAFRSEIGISAHLQSLLLASGLPAHYSRHLPLQAIAPRTPYGVGGLSTAIQHAIWSSARRRRSTNRQTSDLGKTSCLTFTAFSSAIVYFVVVPLLGRRCCTVCVTWARQLGRCSCRRESREARMCKCGCGTCCDEDRLQDGWKATTVCAFW